MAVGTAALGLRAEIDLISLCRERGVDRPALRPFRMANLFDQVLQFAEAVEIRRIIVEEIDQQAVFAWLEDAEYAEHFAEIARKRQHIAAIVGKARPLRMVLD